MKVSIITAMYNEEDSIRSLLANFRRLTEIIPNFYTISFILVDDGSKDSTVNNYLDEDKAILNIKLIQHTSNRGFGAAMRTGILNSEGEIVVCYDADSTYPIDDVIVLIEKLRLNPSVAAVSATAFQESTIIAEVPLYRQFLTRMNSLAYKLVLGKGSKQVTVFSCAFRAYRTSVVRDIEFKSNGFGAAAELLGRLILLKCEIEEVPSVLSVRQYGTSKMNISKAVKEHAGNLIRFIRIRFFNY